MRIPRFWPDEPNQEFVMRDADFFPRTDDHGFRTLLLVSHHGDAGLTGLLAQASAAATVCTPADVATVLRHIAVDVIMVLDDVSAADRSRVDAEAASRSIQLVGGLPATLSPSPRDAESEITYLRAAA
jgi:hypothetical protein